MSTPPSTEPIAIVGSACRFAGGANSPSNLWKILAEPKDLTREIPANRFNIKGFYHPDGEYNGTTNSPKAYFLDEDHTVFDTTFFNILPKEAEAIDPQQRLSLEVVYEALETAGYTLQQYAGRSVAVYTGLMTADYDTLSQRDDLNTSQYYATGNARSIISNRISYFFNFGGPSMTIDTACSSSLVALDQAVNTLRAGKCEMACVTGANLILTPEQFIAESSLHMLSPNGHSRMWDAKADGYARGEGIAAIFIKTLRQAVADGDRIEGVIREIGVNSDGRTKGITMPSWSAQARLIEDTYNRAGLDPKSRSGRCQFFEAHGTGTPAGDPNEARAIQTAFFVSPEDNESAPLGTSRARAPIAATVRVVTPGEPPERPVTDSEDEQNQEKLLVGSIKTVIGHTEGAAGLAGLLKVIQCMQHEAIAPNLHLDELNPEVAKVSANLSVATELQPWPEVPAGQPKRASLNSFGFGGTNSHVILEQFMPEFHGRQVGLFRSKLESPDEEDTVITLPSEKGQLRLPLLLSANTKTSLAAVAKVYRDYILANESKISLEEVAWHTYARRTPFTFRSAVSGNTIPNVVANLDALIAQVAKPTTRGPLISRARAEDDRPKLLGVFTGQGAQWATMSRQLLATSKIFARTIHLLDEILRACPDPPSWTLEQEINAEQGLSRVEKAAISQPLCTAVQIAMIDLLYHLDVHFHAVIGHSSGEIAAAYAAGRISAQHAILISYYRGMYAHLAEGTDGAPGGMMAAGLSKDEAAELCAKSEYDGRICIAAINSPTVVTLSGDLEVIRRCNQDLNDKKIFTRLLKVDTAYHSPHMEPPAVKYLKALKNCNITPTDLNNGTTWVSSVYGRDEPNQDELMGEYWKDNMVHPVLFSQAAEFVDAELGPFDAAIEVGPHPALKGPVTSVLNGPTGDIIAYSGVLDRTKDDRVAFSEFLGWMWAQFGSALEQVDRFVKTSVQPDLVSSRLEQTPLYPWDHSQSFMRESRISRQYHFRHDAPHELLGVRTRDDNKFELRWRNVLKLEQITWGTGHSFQGQHLVPGSGYCSMAYDAAKVVLAEAGLEASVVELLDLNFYSGITLEAKTPGIETLFSLTTDETSKSESIIRGAFTLTSCPADGTTEMKKNFGGRMHIILAKPTLEALPARIKNAAETSQADPAAFYTMMAGTGLEYTGPFQGLTALQKCTDFSSAKVKQLHAQDSTNLAVSPATLDSCLQTAFLTVSSPGDKSLWTSFLPETIDRMRFNVASCEGRNNDDMLTVDAYLVKAKPFSRESAASFTADIEIFGKSDRLQIQVEGLTVASFSTTKPEEDYELYLTTIMDIDPDVEIRQAPVADIERPSPVLVESCERVAFFYRNHISSKRIQLPAGYASESPLVVNGWPSDTQETIDAFIADSPYFTTLDFIRRVGKKLPGLVTGMLPTIIEEAHQLAGFQNHISRVVKQIAHKYPRMNVLGVTDQGFAVTEHVINGLEHSFLSYRVGGEVEKNLQSHVLTTKALRKKVIVHEFFFVEQDTSGELEVAHDHVYDLVIVNTSLVDENHAAESLRKLRKATRPGGFFVLIDSSRPPLWERLMECIGLDEQQQTDPTAPVNWSRLLDRTGFRDSMGNSSQSYPPGYSLIVRQAESVEKDIFRAPFEHLANASRLTERLLIVGGRYAWTGAIKNTISSLLSPYCGGNITIVETLDQINKTAIFSYTAVILLTDIDGPVLETMTTERMETMRALLRPGMSVLWVTHNARFQNPDAAASLGFVRTLLAETPDLAIQVLDLNSLDTPPAVELIKDSFARLLMPKPDHGKSGNDKPLFIYETEVYVEEGRQLVPRCVPWKDGNARNNAPRRVVSNVINTLEKLVKISFVENEFGPPGYEPAVEELNLQSDNPLGTEAPVIRVEYSTADAIDLGDVSSHICLGRDLQKGKVYVGLAAANASYLPASDTFTSRYSLESVNQPVFLALLARYISALTIAHGVEGKSIVLVEPDVMFQDCVKDVLVKYNIFYTVLSTDARCCELNPGMTFIHPRASTREIKATYPHGGNFVIIDMLPSGTDISRDLRKHLPKRCDYNHGTALFNSADEVLDTPEALDEIWDEAVSLALAKVKDWEDKPILNPITVPNLLHTTGHVAPFRLIDWKAERAALQTLKHFPAKNQLNPKKVYILVGITRDFGQSLCALFAEYGARHIILCSRNPPKQEMMWQAALKARGVTIQFEALDVTNSTSVMKFKSDLEAKRLVVGGVVNGAMVLEDKVFSQMTVETLHRVMRPKTIGSKNLDIAFSDPDMDFFVMTSSFAAIGGHAGQSNYAAANMYMNGLAANRRKRGLPGTALNIGVIYGIGFLHREKSDLYDGLEREGYPPISERDIHHMFIEAINAGKPNSNVYDIVTGLARFSAHSPRHHWQQDPRFSHFTRVDEDILEDATEGEEEDGLKELIESAETTQQALTAVVPAFIEFLEDLLQLSTGSVTGENSFSELGVDSLVAVDVRQWIYKHLAQDVAVMKILSVHNIFMLCDEIIQKAFETREPKDMTKEPTVVPDPTSKTVLPLAPTETTKAVARPPKLMKRALEVISSTPSGSGISTPFTTPTTVMTSFDGRDKL